MKLHHLLLRLVLILVGLGCMTTALACGFCPVRMEIRPHARLNWQPDRVEACQILSVPEVAVPDSTFWGHSVAVDGNGWVLYAGFYGKPFAIRRFVPDSLRIGPIPTWPTVVAGSREDWVRIDALAWDPLHDVLWGASRSVYSLRDTLTAAMPCTRIYTIQIDTISGLAECTYRFDGLGVPGANYSCVGLAFDTHEGPHGTLWQQLADGGDAYTPFPLTADLGTTGAGRPVRVDGGGLSKLVYGLCVSPDGKRMYVSHGVDGTISLHDKMTGTFIAALGTGPVVPRRFTVGLAIDHSRAGCPRLICHEVPTYEEWGPTYIVTYAITDE